MESNTYVKIKNPETKRWIYKYGPTYNELLKTYTAEELEKSVKNAVAPKSPKILKKYSNIVDLTDKLGNLNTFTLTGLPDADYYILTKVDDLYTACQIDKYTYQLCMKHKDLKKKFNEQQQAHAKADKLLSFLTKNNSIKVDWLNRPINYNRTGDYKTDGMFFLRLYKKGYQMTAHHFDFEDKFFTYFKKEEIKKVLVDIFYEYPNVQLILWMTAGTGKLIL